MRQEPPATGDVAVRTDELQRRPERRLRARDDWNAVTLLERLGHAKRPQAAARDQQPLSARRLAHTPLSQRRVSSLALAARLTEAEQAEALQRHYLEPLRGEKGLQPLVDVVGIGGGDHDPMRAELRKPSTTAWLMAITGSPVAARSRSMSRS